MRVRAGSGWWSLIALSACGFQIGTTPSDAEVPPDMPIDMSPPPDEPVPRTRTGLIGFWTFDDPAGSPYVQDTSGNGSVPMEVVSAGNAAAPALANGNATATAISRLVSAQNNHLPLDCVTANAVTLEAWVKPQSVTQGTAQEGAFITGLTASVVLRDVALLQAGDHWRALVRTNLASDGTPALNSTSTASSSAMTHLVVVADASRRTLYVNGVAEANSPPGALTNWELSYPMMMFDEYQHARQWRGSLALVALYNRALSAADVQQNFAAGPDAP